MEKDQLKKIIEGALLAYAQPLSTDKLHSLFATESADTDEGEKTIIAADVAKEDINAALETLQQECEGRGFELNKVGSGWRFQVREETAPWVNKLWAEKPQRYSRALMETLAIIAYRQPITRGDIEEIRGVAVSGHIIKTLSEREWVKVIGHRDVPGRPALYATTKQFLDYFNLESLEELPSLQELTDIEAVTPQLDLSESSDETSPEQTSDEQTSSDDAVEQVQETPEHASSDNADLDDEQVIH